jgi:NADPH-dependent glutamate synthase beta subunit-like oxidoreductase/Pyruvate/2-oxoacid:ferredoxin oxidoreductase delta subunit
MTVSPAPAPQPARTYRRFVNGDHEHRPWQEEIFSASWSHKCPTYVHKTSPCQGACPSGHDVRGWLAIVRGQDKPRDGMSWQEYAFRRMTAANPFPAVMGRVCPAPCEDACNRNEVEDHVGINSIEHFIGDWALAAGIGFPKPTTESGRRVAVVGGGPAGLSAAYHLRRRGHGVTIFDDHDALGGMARFGIPGYRTPREVLDGEIRRILDLGVEVRLGTRVGRNLTIADLERGFDAVFWGLGTHQGRTLSIPGSDAPNCITGVAFLRAFNEGRLKAVSGRVVVIGGGDTSLDVASVARRLGHITQIHEKDRPETVILGQMAHDVASTARREGAEVVLTSLFPIDRMMAAAREIEDAQREGVDIRGGIMPLEVLKDGEGRARALRMCRCEMNGMEPIPTAGTEFELPCQLLVVAIGQKGDLGDLAELDSGTGFIAADRRQCVPGRAGHFVGGDIVRPHLLTSAIGQGRIAAESIDAYLRGQEPAARPRVEGVRFDLALRLREAGLAPEEVHEPIRGTASARCAIHNYEDRSAQEIIPHEELFLGQFGYTPRHHRQRRDLQGSAVLGDYGERLFALSEPDAIAEAKRCMSCGLCFECDNCLIYCPQHAVQRVPAAERVLGRYVRTDYSRCIGCHVCHDVCPTGYIKMGLGE